MEKEEEKILKENEKLPINYNSRSNNAKKVIPPLNIFRENGSL